MLMMMESDKGERESAQFNHNLNPGAKQENTDGLPSSQLPIAYAIGPRLSYFSYLISYYIVMLFGPVSRHINSISYLQSSMQSSMIHH